MRNMANHSQTHDESDAFNDISPVRFYFLKEKVHFCLIFVQNFNFIYKSNEKGATKIEFQFIIL